MTVTDTPKDQILDFEAAKEAQIEAVKKEVEKIVLEYLDPYIQSEVEMSYDFHPYHIIAQEALLGYIHSEKDW